MELAEVSAFVENCIYDAPAPCSGGCPFGVDIRSLLRKASKGRISAAYRELRTATVFPAVAAALCDAPCMRSCQRLLLGDEPLDMERLEEAIVRLGGGQEPDVFQIPEKAERVAVIGAGPAGLSAALCMAQKKYPVTVFEKDSGLGGRLREHPRFESLRGDILFQLSKEKIDFRFGCEVTDLDALVEYAVIYVATGAGGKDFGLLSEWDGALYTTARKGTFMGGGVCGMRTLEAIAAGPELSRLMESMIQTGRAAGVTAKPRCTAHNLLPENARKAERVMPAEGEGYTKAEVKQEASRCFQCSCDKCMDECAVLGRYPKPPQQMAMEILADSGPHFLAGRTMTRQVYSCNLCPECTDTCPERVNMGELFQLSRTARADAGIEPEAFHDFWLRELDFASRDGFFASAPAGQTTCEYVFFPGCRLAGSLPEQTLAAQRLLTRRFGAGSLLACCGASAWWAGEKPLWEENSARLRSAWEQLGRPKLIIACASCGEMLARLVPELETVPLYEMLAGEKDLPVSQLFPSAAVFDPCSSRGEGMRGSVRALLRRSGAELEELPEPGRCCGWGGHMRTANPELYDKIAESRAEGSEKPYYVYCANCREVFLEKGKDCRHVLEALFGECGEVFDISAKHQNHLRVKGALTMDMQGRTFVPERHDWDDISLEIGAAVRSEMECQLISDEDVKKCIHSSLGGERFADGQGHFLACLHERVMSYWVEYSQSGETYTVHSAYSHRMKFGGEVE